VISVAFQELTSLQHDNVVSLLECKVFQPLLSVIRGHCCFSVMFSNAIGYLVSEVFFL